MRCVPWTLNRAARIPFEQTLAGFSESDELSELFYLFTQGRIVSDRMNSPAKILKLLAGSCIFLSDVGLVVPGPVNVHRNLPVIDEVRLRVDLRPGLD